jgi:hypothetical protein
MAQMELKIDDATYDELRKALDSVTYNIQPLGGKPTVNIAIGMDVRAKVEALIQP